MKKITVIGAGNGGQALAGDLASKGFVVTLFEHPDFREEIRPIEKTRAITLTGALSATGLLSKVTTDPEEALKEADLLFFLAPSFAQEGMFDLLAPHFQEGQSLLLLPGNFGSLVLKARLAEMKTAVPALAEGDTMPYACRIEEPGVVNIWGIKNFMSVSALPAEGTPSFLEAVRPFFPIPLRPAANVLAIGLFNTNMILHCPTMIMNAGRIESEQGNFRFYGEGMTESVCSVMEALDAERIAVGRALGLELLSTLDDMKDLYSLSGSTLRETILNNDAYCGHGSDAPCSMAYRYLSEDVPFLLVPTAELGRALGVATPAMNAIIHLAGVINETDYRKSGLTLKKMGLDNLSGEEILRKIA
ncbi:MAG: NAD(P)-binding domain-containing protein [Synergistaceae bacterium]|nr:NAD(P)-binding domain-containing protein [Synergistaceae bacterium]